MSESPSLTDNLYSIYCWYGSGCICLMRGGGVGLEVDLDKGDTRLARANSLHLNRYTVLCYVLVMADVTEPGKTRAFIINLLTGAVADFEGSIQIPIACF